LTTTPAIAKDLKGVASGEEVVRPADFFFVLFQHGALNLNNLPAVDTDQVVVMGTVGDTLVSGIFPAQLNLLNQSLLLEELQGAVNGSPGDFLPLPFHPGNELLRSEMGGDGVYFPEENSSFSGELPPLGSR